MRGSAFSEFSLAPAAVEAQRLPPTSASFSPLLALTRGLAARPPAPAPAAANGMLAPAGAAAAAGTASGTVQLTLPDGSLRVGTHLGLMAQRYRYLSTLGEGVSAQVILAEDTLAAAPGTLVAIKAMRRQHALAGRREVRALRFLHAAAPGGTAPGLVRLLDTFTLGGHFCLVTERLYPWLLDWVAASSQLPAAEALRQLRKIAHQLLVAVAHMHNHGVTNADIKPDNILLCSPPGPEGGSSGSMALRLVDLGNSFSLTETDHSVVAQEVQTLPFRAPEAALGLPYSAPIDLFSVGVVLAELALKRPLFPCATPRDLLRQMAALLGPLPAWMVQGSALGQQIGAAVLCSPSAPTAAGRGAGVVGRALPAELAERMAAAPGRAAPDLEIGPPRRGRCPLHAELVAVDASLADLVLGMLHYDPAQRLTAQQALLHPFFDPLCPLRVVFPQLQAICRQPGAQPATITAGAVGAGAAAGEAGAARAVSAGARAAAGVPALPAPPARPGTTPAAAAPAAATGASPAPAAGRGGVAAGGLLPPSAAAVAAAAEAEAEEAETAALQAAETKVAVGWPRQEPEAAGLQQHQGDWLGPQQEQLQQRQGDRIGPPPPQLQQQEPQQRLQQERQQQPERQAHSKQQPVQQQQQQQQTLQQQRPSQQRPSQQRAQQEPVLSAQASSRQQPQRRAPWQQLSAALAQPTAQPQSRLPAAQLAARQWEEQRRLAAAQPYAGNFSPRFEPTPGKEQPSPPPQPQQQRPPLLPAPPAQLLPRQQPPPPQQQQQQSPQLKLSHSNAEDTPQLGTKQGLAESEGVAGAPLEAALPATVTAGQLPAAAAAVGSGHGPRRRQQAAKAATAPAIQAPQVQGTTAAQRAKAHQAAAETATTAAARQRAKAEQAATEAAPAAAPKPARGAPSAAPARKKSRSTKVEPPAAAAAAAAAAATADEEMSAQHVQAQARAFDLLLEAAAEDSDLDGEAAGGGVDGTSGSAAPAASGAPKPANPHQQQRRCQQKKAPHEQEQQQHQHQELQQQQQRAVPPAKERKQGAAKRKGAAPTAVRLSANAEGATASAAAGEPLKTPANAGRRQVQAPQQQQPPPQQEQQEQQQHTLPRRPPSAMASSRAVQGTTPGRKTAKAATVAAAAAVAPTDAGAGAAPSTGKGGGQQQQQRGRQQGSADKAGKAEGDGGQHELEGKPAGNPEGAAKTPAAAKRKRPDATTADADLPAAAAQADADAAAPGSPQAAATGAVMQPELSVPATAAKRQRRERQPGDKPWWMA